MLAGLCGGWSCVAQRISAQLLWLLPCREGTGARIQVWDGPSPLGTWWQSSVGFVARGSVQPGAQGWCTASSTVPWGEGACRDPLLLPQHHEGREGGTRQESISKGQNSGRSYHRAASVSGHSSASLRYAFRPSVLLLFPGF